LRRKIRARVAAFAPQVQELQIKSNNALGYELVERYAGFLAAPLLLSAAAPVSRTASKDTDSESMAASAAS
jgi:hypothetical protein